MPIYEYENRKTGERFTENLPIHKRNFPLRNPFIRRVISAPKISVISDMGGREDKTREQIEESVAKGYSQRDKEEALGKIKVPEWSKEKREKSKQKRQWL